MTQRTDPQAFCNPGNSFATPKANLASANFDSVVIPSAFAESDFSAFWKKFKAAVAAGDKARSRR